MRTPHGCPSNWALVERLSRFICSAHKRSSAPHKPEAIMVENRVEYIAVSTGVVLTALVALIPFIA
jgi:hypothetical protein